jgi:hypothetical protein
MHADLRVYGNSKKSRFGKWTHAPFETRRIKPPHRQLVVNVIFLGESD